MLIFTTILSFIASGINHKVLGRTCALRMTIRCNIGVIY